MQITISDWEKMSERQRKRMLRIMYEGIPDIPARSEAEVRRELKKIRKERPLGGRRTADRPK